MQLTTELLSIANVVTGAILVYFFSILREKVDKHYVDIYVEQHKSYHELTESNVRTEMISLNAMLFRINDLLMKIKEDIGELKGSK